MAGINFTPRLVGRKIALFVDFSFEDSEVMYPQRRLEEEGAHVVLMGAHPAGQKYTGKYGIPVVSAATISEQKADAFDALVIPGGFAPDYMRRNAHMLAFIVRMIELGRPVASICHGPWMLCSARMPDSGLPVCSNKRVTSFVAIKDDVINAGATWCDEPVVVDYPLITARTPADLTPFCHAIIRATAELHARPSSRE